MSNGNGHGTDGQNGPNGSKAQKDVERQSADVRLPNSRRVYVGREDLRVPFREVSLQPTRLPDGRVEENEPVRVYDTSGPWGDPDVRCDVSAGLRPLRREWILARGDVEEYEGREVLPQDDGYLTAGAAEFAKHKDKGRLEHFPGLKRAPLRARPGACVTQMHYARRGIVTPEMEYVALRENGRREWMAEYLGDPEEEVFERCRVGAGELAGDRRWPRHRPERPAQGCVSRRLRSRDRQGIVARGARRISVLGDTVGGADRRPDRDRHQRRQEHPRLRPCHRP